MASESEMVHAPSMARALIWGIVIATIAMFVGTGALLLVLDGELINAVGIGLFCAFWGGLGFGVMAGGAANAIAEERHRAS